MKTTVSKYTNDGKALWLAIVICALASMFYIYDYFVQVAPSIMTQQLMTSFSIDATGLGVLGSCFFISYTIMQIPAGMLLDRYGARKILFAALLISAVGVTLFSMTSQLWVAAFARGLIGFGSAFSFLGTLFLISRWFKHGYFAFLAGILQFAGAIGSISGQGPLAVFINHEGWREATLEIGLFSFVLALIFLLVIRDGKPQEEQVVATSAEHQAVRLFRLPQLWWVSVCAYVAWAPAAAIAALWGVPFLMHVYGLQNYQAGTLFTIFWIVVGVGGPLVGWWSDKIKRRRLPIAIGFFVGIVASVGLLAAGTYPLWVAGVMLFLLGIAVSVQSLTFGVVKDIVPASRFATASGFNNMITVLSGATLQPVIGWLLDRNWDGAKLNGAAVYSTYDYRLALAVIPVVMLIGFLVIVFKVKETHCQPTFSA